MTARRILLFLLFAACIAGGWAAWRLELRLIQLRGDAAAARSAAVGQRLADARRDEAGLEKELATVQAASKSSDAGSPSGANHTAMDPQTRHRAMVAFAKVWMDQNATQAYRRLAQSLGLSAAQLGQLRDLGAERLVQAFDAMRPVLRGSDGPTDPAATEKAAEAAVAGVDGQIQQLLGESGYADYQRQLQLAPAEAFVDRLSQSLAGLPGQFSEDQKDQLAAILAKNQPEANGRNGIMGVLNGLSGNGSVQLTDAAVTQAAAVLSADQLAVLRQSQADTQARNTVFRIHTQALRALQNTDGGADAAQ